MKHAIAIAMIVGLCAIGAGADEYSADWYVVAGGGAMDCAGGEFTLAGTIGQHSTDVMSGGEFTLEAGFWRGVPVCQCYGDMNGDGVTDGKDITRFVRCMLNDHTIDCTCADVSRNFTVDINDITPFVTGLLNGTGCD